MCEACIDEVRKPQSAFLILRRKLGRVILLRVFYITLPQKHEGIGQIQEFWLVVYEPVYYGVMWMLFSYSEILQSSVN